LSISSPRVEKKDERRERRETREKEQATKAFLKGKEEEKKTHTAQC
jgi:hypothetical protein